MSDAPNFVRFYVSDILADQKVRKLPLLTPDDNMPFLDSIAYLLGNAKFIQHHNWETKSIVQDEPSKPAKRESAGSTSSFHTEESTMSGVSTERALSWPRDFDASDKTQCAKIDINMHEGTEENTMGMTTFEGHWVHFSVGDFVLATGRSDVSEGAMRDLFDKVNALADEWRAKDGDEG